MTEGKPQTTIGKRGKMHYRTAVSFLGPRPIAQYNYQAKLKRKQRRAA